MSDMETDRARGEAEHWLQQASLYEGKLTAAEAEITELRRALWMIVRDNNGYMLTAHAIQAYPGDGRAVLAKLENPRTRAVSYSAGIAIEQNMVPK